MFLRGLLFFGLLLSTSAFADGDDLDLDVEASPKKPWGEFTMAEGDESHPWWETALLWLPNRVLDLIDVFRVDVGVGPAAGAVLRLSQYGQVGYRTMMPGSVRIGDFGRKAPAIIEKSNEFGIGPGYVSSSDREVCPGEIGLGADLFIVGAYGGICAEEALDFVAGIFFLDVSKDDLR